MDANKFLSNILNPPSEIKKGQIWYAEDARREFLIIADDYKDAGLFNTVLLDRLTDVFNDGVDVILNKNKFPFLPSDRICLRFTAGPVHKEQLTYYLGEVDTETLARVAETVEIEDEKYDEDQKILLRETVEEIQPLHFDALQYFERAVEIEQEEKEEDPLVIALSEILKEENSEEQTISEPLPQMALAAESPEILTKTFEFWEKINKRPQRDVFKLPGLKVKLVVSGEKLFLIVYTQNDLTIENIAIKQGDNIIAAVPDKAELKENSKGIFYFEPTKFEKKEAELIFKYNNVNILKRRVIFE